jgi:hypothetical protein
MARPEILPSHQKGKSGKNPLKNKAGRRRQTQIFRIPEIDESPEFVPNIQIFVGKVKNVIRKT